MGRRTELADEEGAGRLLGRCGVTVRRLRFLLLVLLSRRRILWREES